jgi:hypothetical protein
VEKNMTILPNGRKIVLSVMLALLLLTSACGASEPTRWDNAQQESTSQKPNDAGQKQTKGGEFNKLFPQVSGEYNLVYSQEKKGFAQAKLKQGGQDVATLSITDTLDTPDTAKSFESSTKQISGYPAKEQGKTMTSVLVGGRYQVKVRSTSLSPSDREKWISQFNLSGLSRLK